MKPVQGLQNLHFGGGVSGTVLNPAVLAVVVVAGVLICLWPRRKAAIPFLVAALLIPVDQVLVLGGVHFPMLRVLVLFGIIRMARESGQKRKLLSGGVNAIDIAVILLAVMTALNGILLFQASGAVVYQLGELYSIFGVYFFFRFLIRDEEDVVRILQTFAGIAAFVAVVMAYEVVTGHNPYAVLGGAAASKYSTLIARDDRFRAQGPFAHSILAGTFGAVILPLFVALWWKGKKYRRLAVIGAISSTVITLACNSSTPVLGYAAGVLALALWPIRNSMRILRWAVVLTLVALHLALKNPVWHLITRIDITGGSSSYHRYMLIDQCIRHFSDWWLMGVKDTSVWGWDMWDTANQYVGTCDNSGLLPFILLISVLVYGFKFLGKARRRAGDKKKALFIWALGSALFANVVAFVGISYWDQNIVAWYALLAMICAARTIRKTELAGPPPIESSEPSPFSLALQEETTGMRLMRS